MAPRPPYKRDLVPEVNRLRALAGQPPYSQSQAHYRTRARLVAEIRELRPRAGEPSEGPVGGHPLPPPELKPVMTLPPEPLSAGASAAVMTFVAELLAQGPLTYDRVPAIVALVEGTLKTVAR